MLTGVVLEAKIDKGKGPVATILVTNGELKKGDYFVCGNTYGKIRAMIDFNGKLIDATYPSSPMEILGINEAAAAGDEFIVVDNEEKSKEINTFITSGLKENNIFYLKKKLIFLIKNNTKLNSILY